MCYYSRQGCALNSITSIGLSFEDLAHIINDFKALHFFSIGAVIHASIFHAEGVRSFPYTSEYFAFKLSYRKNRSGNPACAFRVERGALFSRSTLHQGTLDALEAAKPAIEAIKRRSRTEERGFVDMLPVVYFFREHVIIDHFAIYDRFRALEHGLKERDFFWKELLLLSERGHAYRDVGRGDLVLGHMKQCGDKWDWVALTDE
jgi:hypothetical protein